MSQRTLDDFAAECPVPEDELDRLLEWANRFKEARHQPTEHRALVEYRQLMKYGFARSRGFCPVCWAEANSHAGLPDYHRDDRRDPITESDEKAHAYAENHRHEL